MFFFIISLLPRHCERKITDEVENHRNKGEGGKTFALMGKHKNK